MTSDELSKAMRWVTRLIDYGQGQHDPYLDELTLGEVADAMTADIKAEAWDEGVSFADKYVSEDGLPGYGWNPYRADRIAGDA